MTEPASPADTDAVVDAGGSTTSMSWWTRAWVTLFVTLAVGVVATGLVIARRALDHSVDPRALQQASSTRLQTLDPTFAGMTADGSDTSGIVDCIQKVCASAARRFTTPARTTAAAVAATIDPWATQWGLGSKAQVAAGEIGCGGLAYAPTPTPLCELATYAVPGQAGQQLIVYIELAPGPGAGSSLGSYPIADVEKRLVTAVYVQVLTSAARS